MSSEQQSELATRPVVSGPEDASAGDQQPSEQTRPLEHRPRDDDASHRGYSAADLESKPYREDAVLSEAKARDIVRLFQCRLCAKPFEEAVTLPCGKSICRACIPTSYVRVNISYPALPDRLEGFRCPFDECGKEHTLGDCSQDVILNKAVHYIREQIELNKVEASTLEVTTHVAARDPWQAAGISSLQDTEPSEDIAYGGKLLATWTLAEGGRLELETEVTYSEPADSVRFEEYVASEKAALRKAQEATRTDMDCQVCYALFHDPLTTGCGHTFCRTCLHRILDHSRYCPICRRKLTINPLLTQSNSPSNECITSIIEAFWLDELIARKEALASEKTERQREFDLPLFVCTLSFPLMPTFLHIFEPRYRLMIRRAMEGDRTFGMVLPRERRRSDEPHFYDMGTLLRIVNVQYYPDGRSVIETVGLSRFKVLRHGVLDGYTVGKIERIDDVSLEEEEALEAAEVVVPSSRNNSISSNGSPLSRSSTRRSSSGGSHRSSGAESGTSSAFARLETMSTHALMQFATEFVERMQAQSVPWLTERMLAIYGECPDDPGMFPWWFGSMLPVRDIEKYKLLGTSSVRDRLKICCTWIIEWESRSW